MYKILRIIFCILACVCAAVTILVFVLCDIWGLIPLFAGVAFAVLMFVCKNAQEREERKNLPPENTGDFITGKVSDNKENGENE